MGDFCPTDLMWRWTSYTGFQKYFSLANSRAWTERKEGTENRPWPKAAHGDEMWLR